MRVKRWLLLLWLFAVPAAGQDGTVPAFQTGLSLMTVCTAKSAAARDLCDSYLMGLLDAEAVNPPPVPLCVPRPVRVDRVREAFIVWSERNTAVLDHAAAVVVRAALAALWPCRKSPA